MNKTYLLLILLPLLLLQGCSALLVGGTATGASMAHDRRSAGTNLDDTNLKFKIASALSNDLELAGHVSVSATPFNRVVLLTGQAESEYYRTRYENLVKDVPNIKRVVNEVAIGPNATLTETSKDSYITSKIKLELFNVEIEGFDTTRVKVITERGVVYLMGLLTQAEADAVVEKVRYVSGVKQVIKVFEYI
ncbi:MAG: BON domain-containing protein [Gammaproteobacteria bacterium]|nr:BON domain-containing protein [Gammaproteobacteria bacterium]